MKRIFTFLIALCICLASTCAFADLDIASINLQDGTDEELESLRLAIVNEQLRRLNTRIVLSAEETSIVKGKTEKLTATIEDLPADITAGKFEWTTDNSDIATVQNGTVKAINGGVTTVHCSASLSNGMVISADCQITVNVLVSDIIYNKNAITMKVGETYTPDFSFKPDNASNTTLEFETSNASVATVENGTITAIDDGNVKITASTVDGSKKKAVISIKVVHSFSGEFVSFDNKMMQSVSSQINEATELTATGNNRAILAALLTLEYQYQCPNSTIDYTKPILVSKSGTMAAVTFAIQGDYVMVIYQMHPTSTSYGYLGDDNSAMAKAALEMISDNVWTVPLNEYNTKLEALVQQIQ